MAADDKIKSARPMPGPAAATGNDDEPPLDPAVERVRRKLVRLLIWSFGIMILGLIAVFSTIVYRLTSDAPAPAAEAVTPPAIVNVSLPQGAKVLSTSISGPRTLLFIDVPDEVHGRLIVIETESGKVIGRYQLKEISGDGS